eukprot:PLAT114.1.p1 GENE.PLAT114.1~~PLAT114.1.p1  ORF type:complete len:252 (+),score=98.63 PLAT114.1:114-758(+)
MTALAPLPRRSLHALLHAALPPPSPAALPPWLGRAPSAWRLRLVKLSGSMLRPAALLQQLFPAAVPDTSVGSDSLMKLKLLCWRGMPVSLRCAVDGVTAELRLSAGSALAAIALRAHAVRVLSPSITPGEEQLAALQPSTQEAMAVALPISSEALELAEQLATLEAGRMAAPGEDAAEPHAAVLRAAQLGSKLLQLYSRLRLGGERRLLLYGVE